MASGKLALACSQYGVLVIFLLSFLGYGRFFIGFVLKLPLGNSLQIPLATAAGLGFFIVILQSLSILGQLNYFSVCLFLAAGLAGAGVSIFKEKALYSKALKGLQENKLISLILVATVLSYTFVPPLYPPYKWDEVMYHLPHARAWAQSGQLTVNDWLRYPWFPYNMDLLYSAGYIVHGDIFTHLLHAACGWLVGVMVFLLTRQHAGPLTAGLATIFWFFLTEMEFGASYVDMGVSLFVFSACLTFCLSVDDENRFSWLILTGGFLGLAIGSKYQPLVLAPIFAFGFYLHSHSMKPSRFFWVGIVLLIPCIYWYARNAIATGNPFNPLGGNIFGYFDWNESDLKYQLLDIKNMRNWPQWPIWPAFLAPLFFDLRRNQTARIMMVFCIYNLIVWYVTSHYDRYLMMAYPAMVVLSALVARQTIIKFRGKRLSFVMKPSIRVMNSVGFIPIKSFVKYSLVVLILVNLTLNLAQQWKQLPADADARDNFLRQRVNAYDLVRRLKYHGPRKIYQLGMEGAIYYAPNPIWGDHFGRWRYTDYRFLKAEALALKLKAEGFNSLLVNQSTNLELDAEFLNFFIEIDRQDGYKFYELKK